MEAAVIDVDYKGLIKMILLNHPDVDFEVKVTDRIAQLIKEQIMTLDVLKIEESNYTIIGEARFFLY